ncbi:LytTR family DNA-binding domain-containing protein [Pedobacter sp. R20-19]|uniref:LytR/AlgR family response regulator transcription factor n=1 Tax=Pedobacter sp. R20-19 TaxID=1270196 RepID=UPI000493A985|nr:LytTR family DNA-binding domain-containing protein [Pedobacter sp. R20-19]
MNTFTCIIVDDDHYSTEQLKEYISYTPALKLLYCFNDSVEALTEIKKINGQVDFLFTDIEMPKLNGLELSKQILSKFKNLILVSAHVKYAPEGYSLEAKQFLTKPFDFKKFSKLVHSVIQRFITDKPFIMMKLGAKNDMAKIYTDEIIFIEGASNYIQIHTIARTYVPYYKISVIDEDLKDHPYFLRINKSNIISANHIKSVSSYKILMSNGKELNVSSAYKQKFDWFVKNVIFKK